MEKKKFNRLSEAGSLYLKQHALNPVDWREWSEDAFREAESQQKLVLISIGYSACHWCHVMAHESFEDEETAALMNTHFICIKVDREERPDVDQIYMDACQLINGNGGWPLNAFALPDKRPLHALTYAPKKQWQNILEAIHELWTKETDKAYEYAEKLSHGIKNMSLPPPLITHKKTDSIREAVLESYKKHFDPVYGGQKRAPKFPMPSSWRYLLNAHRAYASEEMKHMALLTLQQMGLGGIYDAVGGGFARYAVDEKWFAPHFEKMLYDNAQLIGLYSYAHRLTGEPFYKEIAEKCIAFCKTEWLQTNGLYQSAIDADSEGKEGYYYTYTFQELESVLQEDTELFCRYFQCSPTGNWEDGRNILFALDTREKAAQSFRIELPLFNQAIDTGLEKLYRFRALRVKPGTDTKCICSWNALLLKGLAEAALFLKSERILQDAEALADAILNQFEREGRFYRIHQDEEAKITAFLEDYACLIDGLISLYQCNFKEAYVINAFHLSEQCIQQFYRPEQGFFCFKASDAIVSDKFPVNDDVICSGNSIMAHNLFKLSWYFDRADWRAMANTMRSALRPLVESSAPWYSHWANLELLFEQGCEQVVLSGDLKQLPPFPLIDYQTQPHVISAWANADSTLPLTQGKVAQDQALIYLCQDHVCHEPLPYFKP